MSTSTPSSQVRRLKEIPALRQLLSLLLLAGAVAAGIALHGWSLKPDLVPLFSQLGDTDTAEVAAALRSAGVPFSTNLGDGSVSVPAAQVHDLRLQLAAQGLPRGKARGFEMLQQEQGFGTSQMIEGARYQHAQETELARTIATLQPVAAARVHLGLPKASAFAGSDRRASASVLVELRAGRTLESDQVASIVHLVASSVPGLDAAAVSVVDQSGRLLTRSGRSGDAAQSSEQYELTRRIERDYVDRIEQLLMPMMGPGRVSAQVSAELDFSVTEEAQERYAPNPEAVRSERSSENTLATSSGAIGVPGAASNTPPAAGTAGAPAASAAAAVGTGTQSRETQRNYEMDKTLRHTRQGAGSIRRLSVAVLVDHRPQTAADGAVTLQALTPAELAQVESLVREAVGFSTTRGDSVSVQNSIFHRPEMPGALPPPAPWEKPELREIARSLIGALVLVVLAFAFLRPLLRNLAEAPVAALPQAVALAAVPAAAAAAAEARLSLSAPAQVSAYEEKLQNARAAVAQDPKRVAQVVKTWVGAE